MNRFDIRDYGTLRASCTEQIQSAVDACFLAGGGEVVVPTGDYEVSSIRLRDGVTLHLMENARLLGSLDPEEYAVYRQDALQPFSPEELLSKTPTALPEACTDSVFPHSRWNHGILRAFHAKNIAVIGEAGAEINGRNCFDELGEEGYRGPHGMNFWFCEGIRLQGYTIRDSANWAHAIQNSRDITLQNVTVLGGHDGFDVRSCDDILIENCTFRTGDDCIAGFDNRRVTVRNCFFDTACSMMRFGGTDVLVEHCRGKVPSTYGFRGSLTKEERRARAETHEGCRHSCHNVLLYYCDPRAAVRETPGKMLFRNCTFENPDSVMRLPFGHKWCCNRSLADVTFEHCQITGVKIPVTLKSPADEPITFTMRDCVVEVREGFEEIPFLEGENVRLVTLENTTLKGFCDPKIIGSKETQIQ